MTNYPKDKFRVLIVDDEEGPRRAIEAALYREKDLEIRTARSGEEALHSFDEGAFDLVLTDIRMPQMDGIDLLRRIHERSPDTLVILITGYGTLNSAIDAIRAGAYDYLTKPFKVEELCIVVDRAIEKIKLLRENGRLLGELTALFEKIKKNIVETESAEKGVRNLELLQDVRRQLSQIYVRNGGNGKG
ncbi:MAG: sigma-54-dependent Fis family transcriptional regulator [Nitrospirae bacterium]|nr:sigma-54-dependent Fis family transcriptional regulator [Nitrospirota bacterium]